MAQQDKQQQDKRDVVQETLARFATAAEVVAKVDMTGQTDGTAIIDPMPGMTYANVNQSQAQHMLDQRVDGKMVWAKGEDRLGRPARTRKPLRGLVTIMTPTTIYDAMRAAEQRQLDVRDASLRAQAERRARDGLHPGDRGDGMTAPEISVRRAEVRMNGGGA